MANIHRKKPVRSTGVASRANYRDYKEDLRSDFSNRCGYCDDDDLFVGGRRGFHIEHFAPKSKFEHVETEYTNLIYSCPLCNIAKSDDWPSDNADVNVVGDKGYIDPCSDEYDQHIERDASGRIVPKTNIGKYMHKKLKLHLMRHEMIWSYGQMQELIGKLEEISGSDAELLKLYRSCDTLLKLIVEE